MRLTIPSFKKMKVKNIRIVGTIKVPTTGGDKALKAYQLARLKLDVDQKNSGGSMWSDLESPRILPDRIRQSLVAPFYCPRFEVHVVGYNYSSFSKHGVDRRHALSILRKAGLVAPSTEKTILLACHTIVTGEVCAISKANGNRRVMAAVPIHPEMPYFYYFGMGFDGKGDFQQAQYNFDGEGSFNRQSGDGNLYFWHEAERLPQYNFPLLLGIKPS
jgi:hypothetical protein